MKRREKIFLTIIIFFTIFFWVVTRFFQTDTCDYVTIKVSGETFGTYSLKKNEIIPIHETNVLEIRDGKAVMIDATCPDHLCMEQYPIGEDGGTIVCLPNKVVVEGGKTESSEIDAVS